ncbi:DUF1150 family protein [Azospirillum halopraeferens]|uniref:DUF1150 family protein n=1 Tax=Azospirillum halopraeferens TaxID=34010 RepID=UPI0003F7DF56|nr:DUF1150 family protein [Azospirillum halopraeferens]
MNIAPQTLQLLSPEDFAAFGVNHVAYVKQVDTNGAITFAVHAADGTPLTVLPNRDVACAAVRQHDMEPVSVH